MDNQKYKGWSNKATWLVSRWLDSNDSMYQPILELKEEALDKYQLAKMIEDFVDNWRASESRLDEGLFGDLITYALGQVNFAEIAEKYCDYE